MSLKVEGITAGYHAGITILQDVHVVADEGRVTSIIGPNGAGKSTLLKTVYGILRPWKGRILFEGRDITGIAPHQLRREGIAYIPQEGTTFPYLTVEENLKLAAWSIGGGRAGWRGMIAEAYSRFPRLQERRKVRAGSLSGGEQRMLDICKALMAKPKLLMLDEPASGLAPRVAAELYRMVRGLKGEGLTILLVDQNIKEAINLADYVYLIELGKNKAQGAREEFVDKLADLIRWWI